MYILLKYIVYTYVYICYLGTHGDSVLASKSRILLVNILLVVAKIFPDRTCSELLTAPSLLELAATISPQVNARYVIYMYIYIWYVICMYIYI
jgi:hypothetical protein